MIHVFISRFSVLFITGLIKVVFTFVWRVSECVPARFRFFFSLLSRLF